MSAYVNEFKDGSDSRSPGTSMLMRTQLSPQGPVGPIRKKCTFLVR